MKLLTKLDKAIQYEKTRVWLAGFLIVVFLTLVAFNIDSFCKASVSFILGWLFAKEK